MTMQPLIPHIFTQIIDFYFYLSKNSVISLEKLATKIKTNFSFYHSLWSEIYKKCQKLSGHAVSQLLNFLTLNLCEFWSRVSSRVKKEIISNLVISLVPYHLPAMHSFHPKVMKKRAKLTSFFITRYEFILKEVNSLIKVWRLEKTIITVFPWIVSTETILFWIWPFWVCAETI